MTAYFEKLHTILRDKLTRFYHANAFLAEGKIASYVRKDERQIQGVTFGPNAEYESFIVYSPYFQVVDFAVKDAVAKIMGESGKYQNTLLIGQGQKVANRFGSNAYDNWDNYKLRTESDIEDIVEHHKEFMEKVGWKFLKMVASPEGVSKYLNEPFASLSPDALSQDEKIKMIRHYGAEWLVNGIISAWLSKEKNLRQLVEGYRLVFFTEPAQKILNKVLEGISFNK